MPSCWSEPKPKDAYILSWISLIITMAAAIGGITLSAMTGSEIALVFGLENCVDFLSSAVVLWRFDIGSNKDAEGSATVVLAQQKMLQKREKRASMAISLVLILLGLGVFAAAADDLAQGEAETKTELEDIIVISIFSTIVFGTLCVFKFHYADKLDSASLYKDGVCSMIGTILAFAMLVNTLIIESDSGVWWLDPFVALLCGLASFVYGALGWIQAIQQGIPVFTLGWWSSSQGDGMDEVMGRDLNDADIMTKTIPNGGNGDAQEHDLEMTANPGGDGSAEGEKPTQLSEVV